MAIHASAKSTAGNLAMAGAFVVWLGLTGCVFAALTSYSGRAGASDAETAARWPSTSTLPRVDGRATLVMVAHTKCACTRASLRELERTLARSGGNVEAYVIFVGPKAGEGVLDIRRTARDIPGVHVVENDDEARLFGAQTSGQTYLFDGHGALVFRGGLTAARGHEGASVGTDTVRRFLDSARDASAASLPARRTDVFGCALFSSN